MVARQRVDCRCGICGELLGQDVSIKQSTKLIAEHRNEAHPDFFEKDQQAGNRERQAQANQRYLDALGEWRTAKELVDLLGLEETTVRNRMTRLRAEGLVETGTRPHPQRRNASLLVFRRAA